MKRVLSIFISAILLSARIAFAAAPAVGVAPVATYVGTTAPDVTADSVHGYQAGSTGINTISGQAYIAQSVTPGAAVWALAGKTEYNYQAGYWYAPPGFKTVTNSNALSTGYVYFSPIYVPKTITIEALGAKVLTVGTSTLQLAIYASDPATGLPTGAALTSTGNIADTAVGPVSTSLSSNVRLFPGIYWAAIQANDATVTVMVPWSSDVTLAAFAGASSIGTLTASTNGAAVLNSLAVTGVTYGTWPTVSPTSSYNYYQNASRGVMLFFQVASVP